MTMLYATGGGGRQLIQATLENNAAELRINSTISTPAVSTDIGSLRTTCAVRRRDTPDSSESRKTGDFSTIYTLSKPRNVATRADFSRYGYRQPFPAAKFVPFLEWLLWSEGCTARDSLTRQSERARVAFL